MPGVQRICANNRNVLQGGVLSATDVRPVNVVRQNPISRKGTGTVKLIGSYTGMKDALYEFEVTSDQGSAGWSSPAFKGVGNGNLANLFCSNMEAQEIVIKLTDMGTATTNAKYEVYGVTLEAKAKGTAGNALKINVTKNLSYADTNYSCLEEIKKGTDSFTGVQWDWDTLPLNSDKTLSSDTMRFIFEGDPQIYRSYKVQSNNDWEYHIVPAVVRDVPVGTKLKKVTGSRTVRLYLGAQEEVYENIVTLYDLLLQIKNKSMLVAIPGSVVRDNTPEGINSIDLPVETSPYYLRMVMDGSKYLTGLDDLTLKAPTASEMLTVECLDNTLVGSEVWSIDGTTSGSLGQLVTATLYDGQAVSFKIPQKLTAVVNPLPTDDFYVDEIRFTDRKDGEFYPNICVESLTPGVRIEAGASISLVYTKVPEEAPDCDCEDVIVTGTVLESCLGLTGGDPTMAALDPEYATRARRVLDWRKDLIRHNTLFESKTAYRLHGTANPTSFPTYGWIAQLNESYTGNSEAEVRGKIADKVNELTRLRYFTDELETGTESVTAWYGYASGYRTRSVYTVSGCPNPTTSTYTQYDGVSFNLGPYDTENEALEAVRNQVANAYASGGSSSSWSTGCWDNGGNWTIISNSQNTGDWEIGTLSSQCYAAGTGTVWTGTLTGQAKFDYDTWSKTASASIIPIDETHTDYQAAANRKTALEMLYSSANVAIDPVAVIDTGYVKNDLDYIDKVVGIMLSSLEQVFNVDTARVLWDAFVDGIITEFNPASGMYSNIMKAPDDYTITRWSSEADAILLEAGIAPTALSKKANGSGSGVAGCWSDIGGDYYWKFSGDLSNLLPAFTNNVYHSSVTNADGDVVSTQQFAFVIKCACEDEIKEGDTITLKYKGSGTSTEGKTYQVGDKFKIPVIKGVDVSFSGGFDGDDTLYWSVYGKDGLWPETYPLKDGVGSEYSRQGLRFSISKGGIPFSLGDQWSFSIEGGKVKWRKDGGEWSPDSDFSDTLLGNGLTAVFERGVAPSFVKGDRFEFVAQQPYAPTNVLTPGKALWRWADNTVTLMSNIGGAEYDALVLARHSFKDVTSILFESSDDGFATVKDSVILVPTNEVICHIFDEVKTALEVRLIITGGSYKSLGWWWLGESLTTELSPDSISRRRQYFTTGYNAEMGGTGNSIFRGMGWGGAIEWRSFMSHSELEDHLDMIDYLKKNGNEPFVVLPHHLHPQEAMFVALDQDSIDVVDELQYHPNDTSNRMMSLKLPFSPVML